jgi:DNA repair exonuclease SbcCD ATPase subunit
MATNPTKTAQDIDQLRKRHTELDRRKAKAEEALRMANEQLDALKKQARDTYGTDDLEKLKQMLQAMKDENLRKRTDYQKHLDEIETGLSTIEREYQSARSGESA